MLQREPSRPLLGSALFSKKSLSSIRELELNSDFFSPTAEEFSGKSTRNTATLNDFAPLNNQKQGFYLHSPTPTHQTPPPPQRNFVFQFSNQKKNFFPNVRGARFVICPVKTINLRTVRLLSRPGGRGGRGEAASDFLTRSYFHHSSLAGPPCQALYKLLFDRCKEA